MSTLMFLFITLASAGSAWPGLYVPYIVNTAGAVTKINTIDNSVQTMPLSLFMAMFQHVA
jgi:hypothetical protein